MSVPTPDPSFRWTTESWGLALKCAPLDTVAQHLFTSSQLELTPSPEDTQRTSEAAPQTHSSRSWAVKTPMVDPWALAAGALGATAREVVRVRQVHGRVVRVVRRGERTSAVGEKPDGDAIVSNEPGLVLAVVVADCVPILLADVRSGAAAAVHAGWRGTCAAIVREAVEVMAREFGTRPSDLGAAIGPSIGPEDYEVGETVLQAFRDGGHEPSLVDRWFMRGDGKAPHLDLWHATRDQLEGAGVPAGSINVCRLSTFRSPSVFESYRRDGAAAGRMAAIVKVPLEV
jgi:YfiH family protein